MQRKNTNRMEKVDEEFRREIGKIIDQDLKNTNITGLISVTKVKVSPDLKSARVYISLLNSKSKKNTLEGLIFTNTQNNEEVYIPTKAVFIAIGQIPNNQMYDNLVDLDKGYIITDENRQTKTQGLYAIGDCFKKSIRQLTTAPSDGSIAAINACNYIDSL